MRRGRQARFAVRSFVAGEAIGGAVASLGFWSMSGIGATLVGSWRPKVLLLITLLALAREFGILNLRLPENRRLIPQDVFKKGSMIGPFQFGFEMGTGLRTFVSSTAPYLLALSILTSTVSVHAAVLLGLGFGLGRSVMIWSRFHLDEPTRWDDSFQRRARVIGILSVLAVASMSLSALA